MALGWNPECRKGLRNFYGFRCGDERLRFAEFNGIDAVLRDEGRRVEASKPMKSLGERIGAGTSTLRVDIGFFGVLLSGHYLKVLPSVGDNSERPHYDASCAGDPPCRDSQRRNE